MTAYRDAQEEARRLLDGGFEVRVLESSPPAVQEAPHYADDPTARGSVPEGRVLVSPTATGDVRWKDVVSDDANLREWAADHWLGPYKVLDALPAEFASTRLGLHRLAVYVISPKRESVNGKIGLRYTYGGFGTPFFGNDEQVRVEGGDLVYQHGSEVDTAAITTLDTAAKLVDVDPPLRKHEDFDVPEPGDPDTDLDVDAAASVVLGDWFGLGAAVLESFRAEAAPEDEPGFVQLWPEHFDIALTHGKPSSTDDDYGARANYGFSPGDSAIDEPYAYVGPWVPRAGEFWNAEAFPGAVITYSELVGDRDPHARVLDFFGTGAELIRRR